MLEPARRTELEETWMRWRWMDGPDAQLEEGLSQLSAFLERLEDAVLGSRQTPRRAGRGGFCRKRPHGRA
jgi:hypothetical protein